MMTAAAAAAGDPLLSNRNRANLLEHFVRSVMHAEPAFHWIREQSAIVDVASRNKRDAYQRSSGVKTKWSEWNVEGVDTGMGNDDVVDEMSGELWYNRFRETECNGNNGAYCSSFRGETVPAKDVIGESGFGDVNWYETYKNYGNNITLEDVLRTPTSDIDGQINAIVKANEKEQKTLNVPNEFEKQDPNIASDEINTDILNTFDSQHNELLGHHRIYRQLQDQLETTRNDLSHEAKYKLSKYEQDHVYSNRSSNRRKRSIPQGAHKGHAMEILSGSSNGFSPKFLSTLVKNSATDNEYEEEVFDDEIGNVTTKDEMPESYDIPEYRDLPDLTAKPKKNCTRKPFITITRHPVKAMVKEHNTKTKVDINKGLNIKSDNMPSKQRVGITLEVKINNITRQRIQTLEDLRRRKKDTQNTKLSPKEIDKESIDDIVSGKLPNRLVNAVFEMVRSNDRMKELIRPLVNINDQVNVYNEKATNSKSKLKANSLLSQIMTSMNDIIRDQVREQTCVTLRPDLQRYVDDIRDFYEKERLANGHDVNGDSDFASISKSTKRDSKPKRSPVDSDNTEQHFDYEAFSRSCNHVSINEKYALIIGLMELYERLTDSDRLSVVVQKRYLDDHLHLLDELEMFVHRTKSANRVKKKVREEQRSGRFEKLVRTAETIRKNSMINDEETVWSGFDTDYETNFGD